MSETRLIGSNSTANNNSQSKQNILYKHKIWFLLCLFSFMLVLLGGQASAAASVKPPVKSSVKPSLYLGVHVPGGLQNMSAVTTFEQNEHKSVSIIMWYQGWGLQDGTQNFEPTWMDNVRNHGSIPLVTWEPWLYTQGVNQANYSLESIINGSHDAYITQWAEASKAWGHPYFLRFAPEMNGYWFPWSELANGNKAGQYVQAWRHVHNIFTKLGVKNVSWVWCPNVVFPGNIPLQGLYPGSSYVDWIGMDGYNWANVGKGHQPKTFSQLFQHTYNILLGMSLHKPMMVAETACTNTQVNEANWITSAFTVQLPKYFPQIKAFIWFNQNKETDWRVESSSAAQKAFANAVSSSLYASNIYAKLNISPIPIPLQVTASKR